ncbi:MAG TPA: hypothetical protein ENK18_24325 [Deltaproteobacteria bacterium]|nr:hypothetical protein [Deltaproteobacteria bacterium]
MWLSLLSLTCSVSGPGALACSVSGPGALACSVSGPGALTCSASDPGALACSASGPGALACSASDPGALTCSASDPGALTCSASDPGAPRPPDLPAPAMSTSREDPREALRRRYPEGIARLEAERLGLGAGRGQRADPGRYVEARTLLLAALRDEILPAWAGTPWGFYGTADTPGQGSIACGHFLGTVIEDLGFRVDRLALGRQASEHIVETFAPADQIVRAWGVTSGDFVGEIAAQGDGVYLLGLDFHAATLDVQGDQVRRVPRQLP